MAIFIDWALEGHTTLPKCRIQHNYSLLYQMYVMQND